jgi:hypothetical protein
LPKRRPDRGSGANLLLNVGPTPEGRFSPEVIRLARRGHYYLYETLYFADGERNLEEIREAVGAECGPSRKWAW